jgi:hypothetical protein
VIANVLKAPPLPFIPAEQHGKPVVMALMVHAGELVAGEKAIAPIRTLATPLTDMVRPIRYPEMYAGPEAPGPAFAVGTNRLVDELSEGGSETILAQLETATAAIAAVQVRLVAENWVLREQLGGRRPRLNDDQRRRLAVRATALGRSAPSVTTARPGRRRPR